MANDNAGSLFALGLRLTRLDSAGAPLPGAGNCYVTDSLVKIGFGNTYSDPDTIELKNGQGITCVYYAPPATLLGGTIEDFQVCTPDPDLLQFLLGGETITTGGTNEVQSVTITGTPTGGTFTLTLNGETTAPIAYNAAGAAVQAALIALASVNTGDVVVTGGPGPGAAYVVTFGGSYANTNVASMTSSATALTGGTTPAVNVATTTSGVAGTNTIGYRAPVVNVDPTPNGVAIEAWSRAVVDNAFAATLPYYHWVIPRARVTPSDPLSLGGEDPTTPSFEGKTESNAGFADGPAGDITFPTDRIYQFCRVADLPDLTPGFVTVT